MARVGLKNILATVYFNKHLGAASGFAIQQAER